MKKKMPQLETAKLSHKGTFTWFSPEHAGSKFTALSLGLRSILSDCKVTRIAARRIKSLLETAESCADLYVARCPIRSVRVQHETGAIFVVFTDGREVVVPQEGER